MSAHISQPPRSLPRHIAIIMDGNGRWAQARGLPRIAGHRRGADAVRRTLKAAGSVFALTAPLHDGAAGLYNRASNRFWNGWYALRKKKFGDFRTFVHDLDEIDRRVRTAGFRRVEHRRRRVVWDLAVYAR